MVIKKETSDFGGSKKNKKQKNNYWNFRWLQLRHTQGDSSQLDNQKWIWSSKLRHVATWQNVQVKKQSGNLAKILPGPSKLASFTTSLSFFYFVEICLSVFVLRWKKIKSFKDVPVRRTVQPHPPPLLLSPHSRLQSHQEIFVTQFFPTIS